MSDTEETRTEALLENAAPGWSMDELKALGLAVAALVIWILAIAIFGFAGIIIPALLMVAAVFAALILISLG